MRLSHSSKSSIAVCSIAFGRSVNLTPAADKLLTMPIRSRRNESRAADLEAFGKLQRQRPQSDPSGEFQFSTSHASASMIEGREQPRQQPV